MRLHAPAEAAGEPLGERGHVAFDDEIEVVARVAEERVADGTADHIDGLGRIVRLRDRFEHVREPRLCPELLRDRLFHYARAIASISTSEPAGSAETSIVARAGGRSPTYLR